MEEIVEDIYIGSLSTYNKCDAKINSPNEGSLGLYRIFQLLKSLKLVAYTALSLLCNGSFSFFGAYLHT